MSLISTTIPNLVNGVSQQPYALRLASQCQEQVNGYASVVEGLRKRPGTRHIARFPNTVTGAAFSHVINRDANEQYVVVIEGGDLRVFDIEGNEKTVTFPNGKGYLAASDPNTAFRCVTVADYTFVLNTTVATRKASSTVPKRQHEALVWVRQGSYGAKYEVTVPGIAFGNATVADGSDPSHVNQVTTDYIAEEITSRLISSGGDTLDITRYGSTIWIRRKDGGDFTIRTDDSIGDNGMKCIKGRIQRFSDLPARAVDGFEVEVAGDQSSSFGNYYVRYEDADTGGGAGVWKESAKGGEHNQLDAGTMPHGLVRNADGSFTFKRLEWTGREVGDLESNPFPSFVDRTINDVFFHRNRLGFISDENVVLSRSGDYFSFFRGTATALLDDDPIDVGVSHVKVSLLRHAVPFNESLLLFSDQTQFQLGSADVLTPESVSINQTTEYECSLRAKPVGVGRFVYFAVNRGAFTGIREYYVDGATETEDAQEVTGHVPKYIPGGVFKIAASGNEDVVAVLSDQAPNKIYVYKYYWGGPEKLQSSWSQWELSEGSRILNADFIESRLYLIIERADGVHLEVVNLEPGAVEEGWDIAVHLDRVVNHGTVASISFQENDPDLERDDRTVIELPYDVYPHETVQLVTAPGGARVPGQIIPTTISGTGGGRTYLLVSGDWRGQPFYIGIPYEFRYKFSTMVIKEEAVGGGQLTIGEGRVQLRKVTVLYNNSGYFRAEVTPFRRDTYSYIFSGRIVGSGRNLIGRVATEEGHFSFPIAAKNDQVTIELVNDSFLPCFFLSAEWEAFYTIRSQRL